VKSPAPPVDANAPTVANPSVPRRADTRALWNDLANEPTLALPSTPSIVPPAGRYAVTALLGQGGMGQVQLCRDEVIGREVALKSMRPELEVHAPIRERFLREARVQGQLEHPGIVPVHDLGVTADGRTFFTMKRVRGVTLDDVIRALAAGDPEMQRRFTQRKLLTAFVSVCLAVDFAHQRGVIHRDLKPGNVMLGAYGEVYVLDWGLAKLIASDDTAIAGDEPTLTGTVDALETRSGATDAGAVLGTLGYMAPEHILAGETSVRSDVFALGAILFEMLACEPLYRPGAYGALVEQALEPVEARVTVRAPGRAIAPELDAICERATRRDPHERFASARELSHAVEQFLEGDRDLARRRELAQAHALAAEDALRGADSADTEAADAARSRAMRELGNALALDAQNERARAAMVRLLTEPPAHTPRAVADAIERDAQRTVRLGAWTAAALMLVWFLFIPFFWWMGVRDVNAMAWVLGPIAISGVLSFIGARQGAVSPPLQWCVFAATVFACAASSRIFGPFVLVPTLVATYVVSTQVHPHRRESLVALGLGVLAMAGPFVLEAAGVLPRTVTFERGAITIHTAGTLREGPTMAFFAASALASMLSAAFFIARIREALSRAERRIHLHVWHVQRMMPEGMGPR
jgi:serine/threonine-protein kinase